MLSVKCFEHHLNGTIMQQNELWTSVMSYTFTKSKLHVYGLGIKRNHQNTAVIKTMMKIILWNDCKNGHFAARMGLTLSSMARFL